MVKQNLKQHKHHPQKTVNKQKKEKQKSPAFRFFTQTTIWAFVFLLFFFIILPLLFLLMFNNRIYPRTQMGNLNLSGKTLNQATSEIETNYKDLEGLTLTFMFESQQWQTPLSELGVTINSRESAQNAINVGRDNNLIKNFQTIINAQQKPIILPVVITFNAEVYNSAVGKINDEIKIPLIEPTLVVDNNTITLTPGSDGRELDQEKLRQLIIDLLTYKNTNPITIPVKTLTTDVTSYEEEKTKERAQTLFDKKLTLVVGQQYYDVENQELISLLSFKGGYDFDKIGSLSANLATAFDKSPQDAAFNFENGRVTVFRPGKDGQEVDQNKAIVLIGESLIALEATISAQSKIPIPIVTTPPDIATAEVNDLGIKVLLGRGVSYFRGSIPSRIHNVVLAASRLNGILVKPGDVFSFNDAVGDISAGTGYQQAYIIQNGRTVLGDGGGVCQVSTTLFRAALNSGLPIVERTAHAYRVGYYEQGFGAGIDATVFSPSVDLKFKNDTPGHILIQAYPDANNATLIFELYGTSDGRKVFVSTPRIWDQTPPPPPRYEDDPTLPIGQEKQVDWAAWGAKTSFDYKVTRGSEVLIDKTFYSNFRPWQAVYLRGTKT